MPYIVAFATLFRDGLGLARLGRGRSRVTGPARLRSLGVTGHACNHIAVTIRRRAVQVFWL